METSLQRVTNTYTNTYTKYHSDAASRLQNQLIAPTSIRASSVVCPEVMSLRCSCPRNCTEVGGGSPSFKQSESGGASSVPVSGIGSDDEAARRPKWSKIGPIRPRDHSITQLGSPHRSSSWSSCPESCRHSRSCEEHAVGTSDVDCCRRCGDELILEMTVPSDPQSNRLVRRVSHPDRAAKGRDCTYRW